MGTSTRSSAVRGLWVLLYCWALLLLLVGLQVHTVLGRLNPAAAGLHLRSRNRGMAFSHFRALREVTTNTTTTADVTTTSQSEDRGEADRQLLGPGSSPPKCTYKCGRCVPCKPVHVPIQPGTLLPAEYYPEAWRCKCGNRLYMP